MSSFSFESLLIPPRDRSLEREVIIYLVLNTAKDLQQAVSITKKQEFEAAAYIIFVSPPLQPTIKTKSLKLLIVCAYVSYDYFYSYSVRWCMLRRKYDKVAAVVDV